LMPYGVCKLGWHHRLSCLWLGAAVQLAWSLIEIFE
jgi:hypothetical protein